MKSLGLILVLAGGLILGFNGGASGSADASVSAGGGPPVGWPLIGGITAVIGLILLASGGRRVD